MNDELIEYYKNLLIIQYHNKDKAKATIGALISIAMIYDVAIAVRDGFDIETAIGAQLDILGKYIGLNSVVKGVDFTRNYWGYCKYGDVTPFTYYPYIKYGDTVPDVQVRRYEDATISILSLIDSEYRKYQQLKIVANTGNVSLDALDQAIYDFFGSTAYAVDNLDGTVYCYFTTAQKRLATIALALGLLPKPAGVTMTLYFS